MDGAFVGCEMPVPVPVKVAAQVSGIMSLGALLPCGCDSITCLQTAQFVSPYNVDRRHLSLMWPRLRASERIRRSGKAGQRQKQRARESQREREFRVPCFKVYGERARERFGEIAGRRHCGRVQSTSIPVRSMSILMEM